jgi:alkylation response protein AidB-like acyl-CoA dehydrogenase
MDFTFSEEQVMLQEAARRFIAKDYRFARRQQIKRTESAGFSRTVWQVFADLGLLALHVPEADGGLGGATIDTLLVMGVMGEGLVLEPYLASAVVATQAIASMGNDLQRATWLPAMAAGELIAVLAHDESASRYDWQAITTTARLTAEGYVLQGQKHVIAHGSSADILLVTARIPELANDLAVFAVPRASAGVRQICYALIDDVPACDFFFDQLVLPASARLTGANENRLEDVLDCALAALCAEAVGVLDKLLAATTDYARNRQQFGQPIGKFQALQHRMAEMVLHIEQARSMSYLAAVRCNDDDRLSRRRALSAAKVVIGQACRFVGQQAVQLHGGMGVTEELDVSHYFKRLMAIELQAGSTAHHLELFAAQLVAV